ncbi:MAG: hypothetical protein Q4B84_02330, partial [Clostridia bacterium]|nr:hypothetical protein [Clostridia bacterium]
IKETILPEYKEKLKKIQNDEKLCEIFKQDVEEFLIRELQTQRLRLADLRNGIKGKKTFEEQKKEIEKKICEFPDLLFKNKDYQKEKEKFNNRCFELEKLKKSNWKKATMPSGEKKSKIKIGSYRVKIKNAQKELDKKEKTVRDLYKNGKIDKSQQQRTLTEIHKQNDIFNKMKSETSGVDVKKLIKQYEQSNAKMKKDLNDELENAEKNKDRKSSSDIKLIRKPVKISIG